MRTTIAFIFMVLMAALVGCAVVASRVEKPIAVPVRRLLLALLPPVFGNFLIILSGEPMLATIGCYTYYIGMDVMMMALFYFTSDYCNLGLSKSKLSAVCCALMFVDVVQLVMNARFHQAFTLEPIMVEGYPYYSLVPHLGQGLHRVCCYGIFLLSLGYFGYKTFSSPKIPVLSNVTGKPHDNDPSAIKALMLEQVTGTTNWAADVEAAKALGCSRFVEFGPGKVLSGLIKKIDAALTTVNVSDLASLDATLAALS
jgi:hypothetical protein